MYIKDYNKPIIPQIHETLLYVTSDKMVINHLLPSPSKILFSISKYRNKYGIYITTGDQYVFQDSWYQNIGINVDFSQYNIKRCK